MFGSERGDGRADVVITCDSVLKILSFFEFIMMR